MKPAHSILDDSFRYVPAIATSVTETWRRFGWRPTSEEEPRRQRRPTATLVVDSVATVAPLRREAARQESRIHSGQLGGMMDQDELRSLELTHEDLRYREETKRVFTIMQIFHLIDRTLLEQGHGQAYLDAVLAIYAELQAIARHDAREATPPRPAQPATVFRRGMPRPVTDYYVVSRGYATNESS